MSDKSFPVYKKVFMPQDLADDIVQELHRNPALYRNEQNQLSEGELIRRALVSYLRPSINQLIEEVTPAA